MEEKLLDCISGQINTVIYENDENGYSVFTILDNSGEEITVTGYIPFASVGERVEISGQWTTHATYGRQFRAERANRSVPMGEEAIYEFLASRAIKGIGAATAAVIVSRFSDKSLEIIENHPEELAAIKGISLRKAKEISEEYRRRMGIRRLLDFMGNYGLRPSLALRLYKYYGNRAVEMLKENPYILSSDHIGADFHETDEFAVRLGFEPDDPARVSAAIIYELIHNQSNGHCFIPEEKLVAVTSQLIGVESEAVFEGLEMLYDSEEVIREDIAGVHACYLARLHEAEAYTANRLFQMASQRDVLPDNMEAITSALESKLNIKYAPKQKETLCTAAEERVMIITGGPGTGKTTTIRAILAMYDRLGIETLLAAPTGRAAKRLGEVCNREAQTIHRLLGAGFSPDGEYVAFKKNQDDPLKCDAIILDECSMVDIMLMRALLCALPQNCRIVLVGDADQLPSVGPGNVFRDIIRSNAVPVVKLTEVFRQAEESRIVMYSHGINRGEHPDFHENKGDFFLLRRADPARITETVIQLCRDRLPNNMGIMPSEIQVLCPTRLYESGTKNLNILLQRALNPPAEDKPQLMFGDRVFRLGDRVMQIKNNYEVICKNVLGQTVGMGIFNGDVGIISAVSPADGMIQVDFDGKFVEYGADNLPELEHAFAITVHKSQGSEYRAVILPIGKVPSVLRTRGVLYTAITRARELLILVGSEETINQMIDNHKQTGRYSGLRARLAALNEGA